MAHQTPTGQPDAITELSREQIDQAAAAAAAAPPQTTPAEQPSPAAPPAETTLAYGATGECVTKLANLLELTGYLTGRAASDVSVVDEQLLADLNAAQTALEVKEPELMLPADIPVGVKGRLVGNATWSALYNAAAAKLEADASTTEPEATTEETNAS